jgi:histidinol-phosphate aminotransferase
LIEPKAHLKILERVLAKEPSRMFKYRLDRNERNQPFSDKFIKNIKDKITGELFMVYPELDPIYEKIAGWLGIETSQLMLHSSSEQGIKAVFETYIRPGERVLLHFPGFAMYEVYCQMFQAQIVRQHFGSELDFDWKAYEEKITEDIRMVVVENPNGFLGISPSLKQLESLIKKAREAGSIILVDEAYYHFHDETVIDWIGRFDNLIISRTFSKAFGLAGLRAGYLISQPRNIEHLKKVKPAYEINSVAILLISELLDNFDEVLSFITDTRKNLVELRKGLAGLGIHSSESKANFVAAKLGGQRIHDGLRNALGDLDILIRRPFREERLKEWVRISTAPHEIQKVLLDNLRRILAE